MARKAKRKKIFFDLHIESTYITSTQKSMPIPPELKEHFEELKEIKEEEDWQIRFRDDKDK
jgi:acyl-CoA thioesterase FadM